MSYLNFSFETLAFRDPPEILARNVNEINGNALAVWLSSALKAKGLDASDCWPEDHGWDFSVAHAGAKYIVACSLDGEEPVEAAVVLGKSRSLMDKVMGRNILQSDDRVASAIREALAGAAEVEKLSENSA